MRRGRAGLLRVNFMYEMKQSATLAVHLVWQVLDVFIVARLLFTCCR